MKILKWFKLGKKKIEICVDCGFPVDDSACQGTDITEMWDATPEDFPAGELRDLARLILGDGGAPKMHPPKAWTEQIDRPDGSVIQMPNLLHPSWYEGNEDHKLSRLFWPSELRPPMTITSELEYLRESIDTVLRLGVGDLSLVDIEQMRQNIQNLEDLWLAKQAAGMDVAA